MTPIAIVKLTALVLWCHCAVLAVSWVVAVARSQQRDHVGHVVSLLGDMVPVVGGVVLLVFLGSVIGLPSVVVLLAVAMPAGLAIAFTVALRTVEEGAARAEAPRRVALTLVLALAYLLTRGMP